MNISEGNFMHRVILAVLFSLTLVVPALADTISTVFPPTNSASCANGGMEFLGWYAGAPGTFCASGQDVLKNAIPNCQNGQEVMSNGTSFYCGTPSSCPHGTALTSYNAEGIPTCTPIKGNCPAGQVLSSINNDGSFNCMPQPVIPYCPAGYVVTGNGSSLTCTPLPVTPPTPVLQTITVSCPLCFPSAPLRQIEGLCGPMGELVDRRQRTDRLAVQDGGLL
jgi:hypothetical protein